ncbi:MAG TPA: citrate/2-methylcitrate synthase [Gemmatimonadales bacterium]|nr:citrate/2-methylcitrate synthase [Gemmatimonadales bacterium]
MNVATSEPRDEAQAIALKSSVCRLSAEDGRLSYRGYDVTVLGAKSTYEETAFLLLRGHLPTSSELRAFVSDLHARQKLSPAVLRSLRAVPRGGDAMGALRLAVAQLAFEHPVDLPPKPEAAMAQALRLLAVTPTLVAAWHRLRLEQRPMLPRKSLTFAANFLAMVTGTLPDAEAARALDAALILRADNELNPSTFAARVTAATGADVFGAVQSALSALAGPRHGWHARNVMGALEEIGAPERVGPWVRERLARQRKVPGFGHVVYRGEDPRVGILRALAERECRRAGVWPLFRTAQELEATMSRETGEHPIVDFYLAPLYRAVGLPTDLFTAVFAVSRMAGWLAHILEQYSDDKLIRPRADYIGPVDLDYRPLRQRR